MLITGAGSEREAVEPMKLGAYDYLKKPFENAELTAVVQRATESARKNGEIERVSGELNLSRSPGRRGHGREGELDLSLLPRAAAAPSGAAEPPPAAGASLKERLDAYERGLIVAALEQAGGNRTHAARALGLNRGTLHSKLDKYSLGTGGTEDEESAADA